jgi:hypothetical protein
MKRHGLSTIAAVFVSDACRRFGDANPLLLASHRGLHTGDTIGTPATISAPRTVKAGARHKAV